MMRFAVRMGMTAAALSGCAVVSSARAADTILLGPPPAWVKPAGLPTAPVKADDTPVRLLLTDQQVALERDRQTVYSEVAYRIQTPQGLAAGNISFPWRPDTDALTVHKLLIRRGDQTIDVLASGQTFTVIRRETNLENATLDGVLTANIQPEGLQVGDIIEFATSTSTSDPVLKGHVEQFAGTWNGIDIARAHLRMTWPTNLSAQLRQTAALPALKPVRRGDTSSVELSLDNLQPVATPKGAPARYAMGRLIELTDFASWSDLAALMAPLYQKAALLPADGALQKEIARIRALSTDPGVRAEAALALVQDRVRYVALAMGAGGLVPADAETTWTRRYGDCKAKTAMLLALLHALDIPAEPVAVSTVFGDGLDARLPMIGLFNHVLVRATVAGKPYWLDGTRTGDTALDRLTVPMFGWGLPLIPSGGALVRMMPAPLEKPTQSVTIRIDARAGLTIPAPMTVETIFRGDDATSANMSMASLTGDTRDRALRAYWKGQYDFVDVTSASATFDPATGEQRLTMAGMAHMDWSSGSYETDGTSVGYKADFSRDPGIDHDAPFAVYYPSYTRTQETILLPPGFPDLSRNSNADVDETVAGIAYHRQARLADSVFTIERTARTIAPEFPFAQSAAAQIRLRALAEETAYLKKPNNYSLTPQEVTAAMATTPSTADAFFDRGYMLMNLNRMDEAIADFDKAIALDPKNSWALADRGLVYVWKQDVNAAKRDLDAAIALDPRNPVVLRARGLLAQQKRAYREAIDAYTTSLEVEPGNGFALSYRADAYYRVGEYDRALTDITAALKNDPHTITLYLTKANILKNMGKPDLALAEAVALVAANPQDADAHVVAAGIYSAFKKDAEALQAYDRALAIKPEAYIYFDRSLHRPKADVAGRSADLDAALKLDPVYRKALSAKIAMQGEAGDVAGAIKTANHAIALSPDDPQPLLDRGLIYAKAGRIVPANADFAGARAKALDPGALNNLCWSKAIAGEALDSALADCDAALAKGPDDVGILDSRAFVLLRLGRLDDALAEYNRVLALNPGIPSSLFGRAIIWTRKGDKAKADADLAAAIKIDPDIKTQFAGYGVTL